MPHNISDSRKKSLGMTTSIYLRSQYPTIFQKNPHVKLSDMKWEEVANQQASLIQKHVRKRDMQRSANAMRQLARDQEYRRYIMWYLAKYLQNEDACGLLLGAEDPEVAATYTQKDKEYVLEKARHVADAVRILFTMTLENTPITWLECCEKAAETNYSKYEGRSVANWYLQLHEKKDRISVLNVSILESPR
jgi:hypothetical protein